MNTLDINNSKQTITSLEISVITGKLHKNVMRDIRKMEAAWVKLGQLEFEQSSYINSQNRMMPMYRLTKTECLYIATKFNDEIRAKLVLRWEELERKERQAARQKRSRISVLDILAESIEIMKEHEWAIEKNSKDIKELKARTITSPEYYTIAGYCAMRGIAAPIKVAAILGRKASKICKERNIAIDETHDPRFGRVNTYPVKILDEIIMPDYRMDSNLN